jgi:hypothetical protein
MIIERIGRVAGTSAVVGIVMAILAGCAAAPPAVPPGPGIRSDQGMRGEAAHRGRVLHALGKSYEDDLGDRERAAELFRKSAEASPESPLAADALRRYRRISGERLYLLADPVGRPFLWDAGEHRGPVLLAPRVTGRDISEISLIAAGLASPGDHPVTLIQGEPYPYLTFIMADLGTASACYVDVPGDLAFPFATARSRPAARLLLGRAPADFGPRSGGR